MSDVILHHFALSPFAEKVRIGLGLKQAAWKSVDIPIIMPKPDLMPLTGGYRKTPVMQVGADIYCDTQLIMLELERRLPSPPFLLKGREGEARAITMWIDRSMFAPAVGLVMSSDRRRRQVRGRLRKRPQRFLRPQFRPRASASCAAGRSRSGLRSAFTRRGHAGRRPQVRAGRRAEHGRLRALQSGVVYSATPGRRGKSARPIAPDRHLVGAHEGAR